MLLKDFVSPVRRRRRSRLDRFGRVVDHRWINASNVDVDRFKYGYDRNGNRTYKENGVIATLSEVYTNDNLNQLASYKLGTLNGGKTDVTGTPTNAQTWNYDAVGNWDSVTTNSTTQTRGANRQNEITSVSGATTPTYDNNGNLTKDEDDNRFVYDAWNRLVQIKNSSNTVIATNAFDGLNRKAQVTTSSGTIDRIFSSDWQVLEEKSGSNTKNQYVWSPAYVDAMVLRDRDTDSNGTLDERLYPLQDANWNTTALVNTSGSVVERDTYSPFGVVTFRDASGAIIGASAKDWLFLHQGGQTDSIGNYDFRNRVYSPTLGRWLTNDPLGFAAGDVNFYRYVGNGPGNGLDPSGLERKEFLPSGEPGWHKDFRYQPPKWENHIKFMYELLDMSTRDLPEGDRKLAFSEMDYFINTWRKTPSRQSFMGIDGNCTKFRQKLTNDLDDSKNLDNLGNLGNLRIFNPKFFKYETNENWQYYDRYFYNLFGAEGLGHAAVSITIGGQKFYFDDGWWGYVFRPSDIPSYSLPLNP